MIIRRIAGIFILLSLVLGNFVSPYFYLFTELFTLYIITPNYPRCHFLLLILLNQPPLVFEHMDKKRKRAGFNRNRTGGSTQFTTIEIKDKFAEHIFHGDKVN